MTKTFENSGSEKEFLDIYRQEEMDKYVKPSVTVDSVIFRYYEGRVQTLLIKRKNHPFMGKYALSGGFVQEQEDLNLKAADDAASTHWLDITMVDGQLQLVDGEKQLSHDDLAFDHWEILLTAMERIKGRLEYYPTILSIMPEENTLTTYRQLFGTFNEDYLKMDSTNFLRRFKHLFQKTGRQVATRTRKAATYTYHIKPL